MLRAATLHHGREHIYDMLHLKEKGTSPAKIREGAWQCVHCGGKVIPKLGLVRAWHFAHAQEDSECPAVRELEPESAQHIEMKKALAAKLQAVYGAGEITFEAPLPEAGRIADVLLTLPDGSRIAGEAQRSAIPVQQLQERTESYLKADIDVVWAFEESKVQRGSTWAAQREWLLEQGLPVMLAVVEYTDEVVK